MNKILVTGASGFVGAALSSNLSNSGSIVIGAVRSKENLSKILRLEMYCDLLIARFGLIEKMK